MPTTIATGISIKGTIHAAEPVIVAGAVTGAIFAADHDVTVEPGGRVDGSVAARRILVHGRIKGKLIARQMVWLYPTSSVSASIASPGLALDDGAFFKGFVTPARTDAAFVVAAYRERTRVAAS